MTDKTILVVDNDTYILKKVRGNKTIAEIKVDDKAKKDGLTRDDMVSVIGDTSNFTKAEIENNLFSKFQNVNNTGKAETKASYRQIDNEYRFTTAKKFSFGSLFDTVENRQAPAQTTINTTKNTVASTGNLSNPMNNPAVQIANTFVNNPAAMPSSCTSNKDAFNVYQSAYMDAVNGLNFGFGNLQNMYATLFNYFSKMFGGQTADTQIPAATPGNVQAPAADGTKKAVTGNTQNAEANSDKSTTTSTDDSSTSIKSEKSDRDDESLNKTSSRHHRHHSHYSIYSNDTAEHKKTNAKTFLNKEGQTVEKYKDKNGNTICKFSKKGKFLGESIYYKNSKNNKIKYIYPNGNYDTKYTTSNGRIVEKCASNGIIYSKSVYFGDKRLEYNFATKKCTVYEANTKPQVLSKSVAELDMKMLFGQTYPLV